MKPEIICHIMSSVDGRLLNGRWTLPYDGKSLSEIGGIQKLYFSASNIVAILGEKVSERYLDHLRK